MNSTFRARVTRRSVMVTVVCLTVLALTPYTLLAKTTTWTHLGGDDLWSNPGNWNNGVPSSFDVVNFDPIGGISHQDIPGLDIQEMDMTGYFGIVLLDQPLAVLGNVFVEGALDASYSSLDVGGDLTVVEIFNGQDASVSVSGNLNIVGDYDGSSGGVTTVVGSVDVGYMATLDMGNGTLELEGDFTYDPTATTFWSSTGTLRFQGSGTQLWVAGPTAKTYGNVEVSGGSVVSLSAPALAVEVENLQIDSGTLELDAGGLAVHGSTTIGPGGTYSNIASNATLRFDGPVTDDGTFSSLQSSCTLQFGPGTGSKVSVSAAATFEVTGTPGLRTRLEQDGVLGGTQWILQYDPVAMVYFDEVEIQDSDAQPAGLAPTNAIDLGNNTGWIFPPKTTTWIGGGVTTNWSDAGNWDNGVPLSGDEVLFDAVGGTSTMDIPGLGLDRMEMTGYLGTLTINYDFDTSADLIFDGSTIATGRTFNIGGNLSVLGDVDAAHSSWTVLGNIVIDDLMGVPESFFDVDMSGTISSSGTLDLMGLVPSHLNIGGDLTVSGTLLADGAMILVTGSVVGTGGAALDMGNAQIGLSGDLDVGSVSSMTWSGGGLLIIGGGGTHTWTASSSSADYGSVQVVTGAGANIVTLSAPGTTIGVDDLEIYSGTLRVSDGDLTVRGNLTVEASGTFENLTNMGATVRCEGGVTVNDGTFTSVAGGCTLAFAPGPGGTVDLNGSATFDATGSAGIRTRLEQDGVQGGTQWILDYEPGVTLTFDDVEVQDGYAQPGPVTATGISIDLGNNTNWVFPPKTTTWIGGGVTTNWSDAGNWDNGVPDDDDDVLFDPVGGTSTLDIPGLQLYSLDMTGYLGTLMVNYSFDTSGNLVFDGTVIANSRSINVGGHLAVVGSVDAVNSTWTVLGNIDIGGPFYAVDSFFDVDMSGTISATGAFDMTGSSLLDIGLDLTVSGGTLLADNATITVAGSVAGTGGATLDLGGSSLTLAGDLDVSGATTTWSSGGTLRLAGSGTQNWTTGAWSTDYGNVELMSGGVAVMSTVPMGTSLDRLDIISGTLELGSGNLQVDGDVTVASGAMFENLTNTGATLQFDGGLRVDSGTFRCTAGGCTLRFAAGAPGTVDLNGTATIDVSGVPGNRTLLEQDGVQGGTQWIIDHEPGVSLSFADVEVQDSYAQPGPVATTGTSVDLGNNTNWTFPPKTTTWIGGGVTTNWSDAGNWDNGLPASGDDVHSTAVGGLSTMDLPGLALNTLDMTNFSGTLRLDDDLDIAGFVTTSGTFDLNNRTLTTGGDLDVHGTLTAATAHLSVGAGLHVDGDLDCDNGIVEAHGLLDGAPGSTLYVGDGTLRLHGDAGLDTFGSVTFGSSGRLECLSVGDQDIDIGSTIIARDVTVNHPSPSDKSTFHGSGLLTVGGDLDIDTGVLDLDVDSLRVGGETFVRLDGTFQGLRVSGYPSIVIDQFVHVSGSFSFTKTQSMRFGAGLSVTGDFHVTGDASSLFFAPFDSVIVFPGATFEVNGGTLANRARILLDGPPRSAQWHLNVHPGATTHFENIEVGDSDATPGETCVANGEAIDLGNNDNWEFVGTAAGDTPPSHLSLRAVPNPFNPQTTLHYGVPHAGEVTIRVYDVRGALVRTVISAPHAPGVYSEPWDGRDDRGSAVATGVYLCRIEGVGERVVQKLVLLK